MPFVSMSRLGLASVLLLAGIAAGSSAGAQEPAPSSAKAWEFSLTPYVWGTALKGDVGVGRTDTNVDASFDDILDSLNGALMLSAEARKGRFALISDTVFANLGSDGETTDGRLKIDAEAKMWIQSFGGAYRIGTWKLTEFESAGPLSVSVDPYAGARYTYLNAEVKGRLDLPDFGIRARRTAETSESWVDPFIGLRTNWTLGDRWSLLLGGDVGGISTSEQYSAEAYGLAGYKFGLAGSTTAQLRAGYRVLKQKYEDGDGPSAFAWDMTIHGPVVGLLIAF